VKVDGHDYYCPFAVYMLSLFQAHIVIKVIHLVATFVRSGSWRFVCYQNHNRLERFIIVVSIFLYLGLKN